MVKYNELFRKLKKEGWYVKRQKGSHVIMLHREREGRLTIPYHAGKEVKKGLLRSILKQSGLKLKQR